MSPNCPIYTTVPFVPFGALYRPGTTCRNGWDIPRIGEKCVPFMPIYPDIVPLAPKTLGAGDKLAQIMGHVSRWISDRVNCVFISKRVNSVKNGTGTLLLGQIMVIRGTLCIFMGQQIETFHKRKHIVRCCLSVDTHVPITQALIR